MPKGLPPRNRGPGDNSVRPHASGLQSAGVELVGLKSLLCLTAGPIDETIRLVFLRSIDSISELWRVGRDKRVEGSRLVRKHRQQSAKQPPPASPRGPILSWALLCAVIAVAYANTIWAPFVLDDLPNIVNNRALTEGFSWRSLFPPLGTGVASRPVVNSTLALNWAIAISVGVADMRMVHQSLHPIRSHGHR